MGGRNAHNAGERAGGQGARQGERVLDRTDGDDRRQAARRPGEAALRVRGDGDRHEGADGNRGRLHVEQGLRRGNLHGEHRAGDRGTQWSVDDSGVDAEDAAPHVRQMQLAPKSTHSARRGKGDGAQEHIRAVADLGARAGRYADNTGTQHLGGDVEIEPTARSGRDGRRGDNQAWHRHRGDDNCQVRGGGCGQLARGGERDGRANLVRAVDEQGDALARVADAIERDGSE